MRISLRPATIDDAGAIARILRASMSSHDWMPTLHTPDEDLAFIRDMVLPSHRVTVAMVDELVVGFIAVKGEWIDHLYVDPNHFGHGIGKALLAEATTGMDEVKLHTFQQNVGARRFYEREGFVAEAFGDGSGNEEGMPDVLFVRAVSSRSGVRH